MISSMDYRINNKPIRIVDDRNISRRPIRIVDLKVDKSKLIMKSLILLNVGHIPDRIHYRKNASFTSWAIVYIAEGSGTYQVNDGEKQQVKKGSLFILYPNAMFHYGPGQDEFWDEHYFNIEGARIQEWMDTGLIEPGKVKRTDGDHQAKINRISKLMESGIPSNVDRAALLLESLLFELVLSTRMLPQAAKTEDTISLMDDISDSLYHPFDARQICDKHHISIPTLRRIVSKYTGYPLHEYIHRLKMAEAKNILLNTEKSVKEIASALGYHDVFYFSRLFKKFVDVSPNVYRHTL